MKKGFTLMEVLIAAFVITSGVAASYMVVQQIFTETFEVSSRLTAAYIAKEGIEIARNIRDTGWLEGDDWDDNGLALGNWQANYGDYSLTSCAGSCEYSSMNSYIYLDGTDSIFKRRINIQRPTADSIKVTVDVFWKHRSQLKSLMVQSFLYDWR